MPHDLPSPQIEESLAANWPTKIWCGTRQLVAVSGGADSVALLRAMLRLAPCQGWIDAAHFNHGWRGAESDADQQFVQQLCQSLEVRLFTGRSQTHEQPLANEEGARRARYDFLIQTAYQTGARYVLTAHTADDRVETLLHNLFRGTGLAGIAAPTLARPLDRELVLARPLLECTREQVLAYLACLGQGYREDESNANIAYRRNYIRHRLLPLLRQQYGSQVDARLLSFSQLAEDALDTLRSYAEEYLDQVEKLVNEQGIAPVTRTAFQFPSQQLLSVHWPVLREALNIVWLRRAWPLQAMTREQWEQVREICYRSDEGACLNLPGGIRLRSSGDWLMAVRDGSGGVRK